MKYLQVLILLTLVAFLATPAFAQRDAYTSSARAAYSLPEINTELNIKKNKKSAKKGRTQKARKLKFKDSKAARVRRSSLHF
ncbi:hypothetical protein [Pseudochryseolinea flava]|uniref:Uncharacterized protein n=1 Tax=Pseudochryseolinea flava TaxID=2059302 RepID=A0A364Y685_9BACT|nr:hypothetical protein [Pseudochryseolinea flava]RAW02571.1 hypothetical protein DQQ10_00180 [Pseudochryseolinea flava]